MRFIGIDPGITGYLVGIDTDGGLKYNYYPMPTLTLKNHKFRKEIDSAGFKKILIDFNPDLVFIEQQLVMPTDGKAGLRSISKMWGFIQGVCVGMGLDYMDVHPKTWQKLLFKRVEFTKKETDIKIKEKVALAMQRLFPSEDFRKSSRCIKLHQGKIDAAAIVYVMSKAYIKSLSSLKIE